MYYSVACEAMHPDTFVFLFHTSEDRTGPVTPFIDRAFVFEDTDNEHLMLQKDFADVRTEERVCGQYAIKRVLIAGDAVYLGGIQPYGVKLQATTFSGMSMIS